MSTSFDRDIRTEVMTMHDSVRDLRRFQSVENRGHKCGWPGRSGLRGLRYHGSPFLERSFVRLLGGSVSPWIMVIFRPPRQEPEHGE